MHFVYFKSFRNLFYPFISIIRKDEVLHWFSSFFTLKYWEILSTDLVDGNKKCFILAVSPILLSWQQSDPQSKILFKAFSSSTWIWFSFHFHGNRRWWPLDLKKIWYPVWRAINFFNINILNSPFASSAIVRPQLHSKFQDL